MCCSCNLLLNSNLTKYLILNISCNFNNCHTAKNHIFKRMTFGQMCIVNFVELSYMPLHSQRLKNTTPMHLCGPYSHVKVSKTCNYGGIQPQILNDCHRTLLADLIFDGIKVVVVEMVIVVEVVVAEGQFK